MFNNKYSKLLTIILIIVIIVIIGLLAFLGYDVFKKYTIESESEEVVSMFESMISSMDVNTESSTTNAIELNVDLNSLTEGSPNSNSSSGGSTVTYKGNEVVGTIEIPETGIEYPIFEDASINGLENAICKLYGELNEQGSNAVLVGHNYRNGTFFSNNKKLENGDKIYITDTSGKKVTYVIYKKYETSTGDFSYASREIGEKREISLSTCTDDSKRRLIIWAIEE